MRVRQEKIRQGGVTRMMQGCCGVPIFPVGYVVPQALLLVGMITALLVAAKSKKK